MSCTVPANQPIYQALLDKAASYPADKPYQAKAYKKAAESVLNYNKNFYDSIIETIPGIGQKIEEFIDDFVASNPLKPNETVTFPAAIRGKYWETTTWDAFRQNIIKENYPVYSAENPRRSKRLINKPKVQYFSTEDEIAETIEAVCIKKGWVYDDELITEFNTWLPNADKYSLEKYDWLTGKYILRDKPELAKYWAQHISSSLQKQKKQLALNKALIKYCIKNNIEYQDEMADKFAAWMADPANKKLITKTYKYYGSCSCGSCNPTGTQRDEKEYSYDRSPAYCINKWFSTLKKTIVW